MSDPAGGPDAAGLEQARVQADAEQDQAWQAYVAVTHRKDAADNAFYDAAGADASTLDQLQAARETAEQDWGVAWDDYMLKRRRAHAAKRALFAVYDPSASDNAVPPGTSQVDTVSNWRVDAFPVGAALAGLQDARVRAELDEYGAWKAYAAAQRNKVAADNAYYDAAGADASILDPLQGARETAEQAWGVAWDNFMLKRRHAIAAKRAVYQWYYRAAASPVAAERSGDTGLVFGTNDDPNANPDIDTGHYDDGHAFSWDKPGPTPPAEVSPYDPNDPDTGHYDDGHAFGWYKPDTTRWLRSAIIAGGAAVVLATGALFVATRDSGHHTVNAAARSNPPGANSASTATNNAGATAIAPPNTVLASCFQLDVRPGATTLIPTFITSPLAAGSYHITLSTTDGDKTGSGAATEGATFVAVPVEFTRFTTINGITITGPQGAVAPGTFTAQLPFPLDAAHDHPTDCDGSKLSISAPAGATGANVNTQIAEFLSQLAANTHSVSGVDSMLASLDRAVIARYGLDQCRAFLATTTDTTAAFNVVDVAPPGPFEYTSDGQSTTVPDTFAVHVQHTVNGQATDETVHVARNQDGTLSWFTRCHPG